MGISGKESSIMYMVSFPGFKGQRVREGEGERTEGGGGLAASI